MASARSTLYVGEPHSSPVTRSGSPVRAASRAALRIFAGKSGFPGPNSHAVRTIASCPRATAAYASCAARSPRSFEAPYGFAGAGSSAAP